MLTYCMNIHPGESWGATFANLNDSFLKVKQRVSPNNRFPVGLRLSARAAAEISPDESHRFADWCLEHDCFVPTINGFPFGSFHGQTIKENVYLPDWRSIERVRYTKRIADLLASWLPDGLLGSISTVPIGFRSCIGDDDLPTVRRNLFEVLEYMETLRQQTSKDLVLALEPEPGCLLETSKDVVRFIEALCLPSNLSDLLGVCYDCCHQAVEFEEPNASLNLLADADIRIGKVQVSSALLCQRPAAATLMPFCESTYLHQVVVRRPDGNLYHFRDVPEALQLMQHADGEWRVHFHVPVFAEKFEKWETTRFWIEAILPLLSETVLLEVETYTWTVLPQAFRTDTVTESIVKEIRWTQEQIQ